MRIQPRRNNSTIQLCTWVAITLVLLLLTLYFSVGLNSDIDHQIRDSGLLDLTKQFYENVAAADPHLPCPSTSATTTTTKNVRTPPASVGAKLGLSAQRALQEPAKSLHPDWKLWHEMNPPEQEKAMERVAVYVKKYGNLITRDFKQMKGEIVHGTCPAVLIGTGHKLCGPPPPKDSPCVFFSFGINDDASFDRELAEQWNCRGLAGDPTVDHPSRLHPKVTFHNLGATILSDNEERLINKGGTEDWWTTSMPKLKDFLGLDHVHVIKLDCEGCEVAFARDILAEDPTFLHHVDQLSIETHVTKTWISSSEQLYYFGLQFPLLEEAGFQLELSNIFGCSKRHEDPGCLQELLDMQFPCGFKPWPGHPNVVRGYSCHDFLWKRYPLKTQSSSSSSTTTTGR